ncbi:hypothetical protein JMM61_19660 [Rhodovulum sulfidophilum]|uniref:hypothetical protein n=1 Tax=Rhodovulum sulfidophilum TaxID=35806 RepID=UPI001926759B|nr:hypothetical protein [Rhodovulum sulfidophilum]MBL3587550.1 hypothetical protein [Rhodovulum sulfidophilum]
MSKGSHPASGFVVSFATTLINIGIAVVASIRVYISYLFEVSAYSALLGPVIGSHTLQEWQLTGAECLAIGLNGAKVALIFIIAHLASQGLRGSFQLKLLRGLVLLLSLLMTLFVFAGQTVSPKAEARLQELQSAINDRYEASIDLTNGRFDTQRSQVIERFEEELELLGDLPPRLGSGRSRIFRSSLSVERRRGDRKSLKRRRGGFGQELRW